MMAFEVKATSTSLTHVFKQCRSKRSAACVINRSYDYSYNPFYRHSEIQVIYKIA